MKIDSHQHFWKYNPVEYNWIDDSMKVIQRDFLPVHLEEEQKLIGFDGSIAVQARQSILETDWLLSLANENPFIKGVVGWVDLQSETAKEQLEKYTLNKKFVGVRHVVQGEPEDNFILGNNFNRGVSLLNKFGLTYDILVFPRQLPFAVKFAEMHPEITLVLDHIAKPFIKNQILEPWKTDIIALAKLPNVYCKVSGMVTETNWNNWKNEDFKPYLDIVFDNFGTNRVMIGSDWPVCKVAGTYSEIMNIVFEYIWGFSDNEKSKILGENCLRAYNIKGK